MDRRAMLGAIASGAGLLGLQGLSLGARAQTPQAKADQGANGRWLQVESANFVVQSSLDEKDTREEVAALEAFHALMMSLLPRPADFRGAKLLVQIAGTERDFKATAPGSGRGIAGFYAASVEGVRAVTAPQRAFEIQREMNRNIRALDARTILFHEYAHHCMFANVKTIYPAWYVEGFAEYFSTAMISPEGAQIGMMTRGRAQWLLAGRWMPIEKFLKAAPLSLDNTDGAQFYAQAWLVTHLLVNRPERSAGFARYVTALMKGGDAIDAFEPAFGLSPQAFDRELKAYNYSSLAFAKVNSVRADPATPMTVTRLSPAVDNVLMPASFLMHVPTTKSAADSVAAIRKEAKAFPDDPIVGHAMAFADIWYGDLAAARSRLDALLQAPTAQTHHLSGLCDLRRAYAADDKDLFETARAGFVRAYELDNTRASSLFRYAECAVAQTGKADTETTNVLVGAYRLTPQVEPVGLMAAQALMENGRFAEAAMVLRPLAANAHGGELTEMTRKMLEDAQAERVGEHIAVGWAKEIDEDQEDE